jgi:glycosyltransferase involved in cell wall biosynthesis
VIALAAGGALESVIDGVTGAFFDRPEVAALGRALERFRRGGGADAYDPTAMRAAVQRFRPERFREQFFAIVDAARAAP